MNRSLRNLLAAMALVAALAIVLFLIANQQEHRGTRNVAAAITPTPQPANGGISSNTPTSTALSSTAISSNTPLPQASVTAAATDSSS